MAESFIERRKRELGITPSVPVALPITSDPVTSVPVKEVSQPKTSDFVTRRKMELGLIPDTRTKESQIRPVRPTQIKSPAPQIDSTRPVRPTFFAETPTPPNTPKKSAWVSPLDNPIVRGAEIGLSWAQKPFETASLIGADIVGQTRNLLGSKERTGYSGEKIITKPSESIDLGKKLKEIWTQTKEKVPAEAWRSTLPNLGKVKGTSVDWTDVIDLTTQSISPTKLATLPLKSIRGLKAVEEAKVAGQAIKNIPSYEGVGLTSKIEQKTIPTVESQAKPQSFFTQLFGEQNVGFTPFGSKKSGKMISTEQQIVSKPLISSAKGLVESGKQTGRAVYQNTVDYLHPLKKINPETYNTAMDSSRANNIASTIIKDKFVDNEGNVIGNSLNDVMKSVRGLGKKFDDYLVLRHSVDRMNRGERVYDPALNMTPEKASERVKVLEQRYPQLKKAGEEWNNLHGNLLDSGVKEGLLTPEARDTMRSQSPNYASMRRQFTIGEKLAQPKFSGGTAFSGQKAPIKSVSPTGSIRKIVSPVRTVVEQIQAWKQAELRNRTMQSITKAIQLDPEGMKHIVEIVKKPSTSYRSLDDALREGGSEEFLQQLDNDFKSLFKPTKTGEENIVRAMVNGHPVFIKVHDAEAVKALLGMGSDQSGYILDAFQKLSNATKRGATGLLAPMFAVKSLSADVVQAAIQSPNAFKHVAVDLPHALISSIADVFKIPGLKNLAEDFRRSGGEYSALLRGERALKKSLFELRKEAPLSAKGLMKGTVATVKAPFKALEKVADISENANRMAAFRRAMVGKERTPENVRNAINAARESTTSFSRKGAFAKETEAIIPYSNAAIQGMYRVSKAFYKNPIKTLAGVGTLIVAPKLVEYAKFHNDPDYQNIPARERYRNIILSKNADGTFKKQFMPPEYEALGAFITDVLRDVIDKDPQAYKGTLDAIVNAWTPPVISGAAKGLTQGGGVEPSLAGAFGATVLAPFISVLANKSFTGAPIEPMGMQGSPKYRYDERTSAVAKKIGEITGFSPMKTDYVLRAYGGDPARILLPLTSQLGGGNVRNTLLRNFIVDPTFTNNLANDFYKAKEKITQAKDDLKDHGIPLPKWYDERLSKEITSTAAGSIYKRLSIFSAEKREITKNKLLKSSQKTEQLRAKQVEINKIYVDINSRLYKQNVPLK